MDGISQPAQCRQTWPRTSAANTQASAAAARGPTRTQGAERDPKRHHAHPTDHLQTTPDMDPNTVTAPLAHLSAQDCPLVIIGLGHVGLPLAVEFGKHRPVVAFDINQVSIVAFRIPHELGFGRYALTHFDINWLQGQMAGTAHRQ